MKLWTGARLRLLALSDDPFVVMKLLDRFIGFIQWDFRTRPARAKLALITTVLGYFTLTLACLPYVNPANAPIDFYFGMWFVIGAAGSCTLQWSCLAIHRRDFATIVRYLTKLQLHGANHPLRVRARPKIILFSALYWLQNVSQASFWAGKLMHTCPLAVTLENPMLKTAALAWYPVEIVLQGVMSNTTQVITFSILMVFTVEFSILCEDFREALEQWDVVKLRHCIQRHQKLLDMVTLLRDKVKVYLLLTLQVYLFMITFACFLCVAQLGTENSRPVYTMSNGVFAAACLLLFGYLCDSLETKVTAIGLEVYGSDWPNRLTYHPERAAEYRSMKKVLLVVMMRGEKRVRFSCGGVYNMSLMTCWSVLELCYSMFTLLLSFVKEK